jgi:hypothetical protein
MNVNEHNNQIMQNMIEMQAPLLRYVPLQRAFAEIGVGRTRGYRMIAEGLIRAVKLGRKTYVDWNSVEAMFATLPEMIPTSRMSLLTASELGLPDEPADVIAERAALHGLILGKLDAE